MQKEVSKNSNEKAKISSYSDLIIWQKSHELALNIHELVQDFPQEEKYTLVSQIKRLSIAIPTNIVEGFSRWNTKESLKSYGNSDSSLSQLGYLLYLSKDLGYIKDKELNKLNEKIEECTKLTRGWIKSIRNRQSS
jgi:four helix bundle protein